MQNLSDKEIKEAMSKYENKHTPRFKSFQILSKRIEDIVPSTKNMWKTIFNSKEQEDLPEI